MPNAHESTDPWPAPPQEDRSSPDPSSALQALQPLCFTQALFDNRSALEAVLAHLFTPSFEDFADFEDAELENDSDISAEPSVPAGWAATVMAIPDTLSPDLERALTALLPEETQHRLMRFTHPARRLQSLFGRLLAQRLANLASHAGQSPYHLREQPPEGPQLTDFSGVSVGRFAVAHTDGCVAVSLSRRAMGIDLEQPTRAQQTKRLVSLAEFAFGARFARTIAAASAVNLTRAHLEEDAGKSIHGLVQGCSGIDLNRAGTPLLEIVTEPEMRSAAEAVGYARALHALVVWLGISDGNMQEGNFRCDANVSVRPVGQKEFGTRCEIKNLNSFRFLQEAIDYEVRRQIELIEDGGKVVQATRLYDPDKGETRQMRTKEDSMDYRYFPDPDLLPLEISDEWIERVRGEMPELPHQLCERLQSEFGLPQYDASMLTASRDIADYYVALAAKVSDRKMAANWVMGELSAAVNGVEGMTFGKAPVTPEILAAILGRILDNTVNQKGAKQIFAAVWEGEGTDVDALIESKGLKQISDTGALEGIIDEVLAANQKSVDEFRAGKQKAFNALVGQCMKATRGKANPAQVNELLRKKLGA